MIALIKKQLLDNPKLIVNILEKFGFDNIVLKSNRITCALDSSHDNAKAISIKLDDNENLYVKDFVRGTSGDLINFIIETKEQDFRTVIMAIKSELGIDSFYEIEPKTSVFGGFYSKIKKRNKVREHKIYDDSILDYYEPMITAMFLKDHISVQTHRDLNILYDLDTQRIVFPVYDWMGNIIGIKGRLNDEPNENEPKYMYPIPCSIADTLYGYWQNYKYMLNSLVIVVESEKAFFQAYSYGFRNIVALGCGTISPEQCKLIISLNPKRVIFCNDEGYNMEIIERNINMLKAKCRFYDFPIDYWHYEDSLYIEEGSKDCITDRGKETFFDILRDELEVDCSEGLLETT